MNTKAIGDIAEAKIITKCLENDWDVSIPFGDNYPYDLVIDKGNGLKKVQIKSGRKKDETIIAALYRSCQTRNKTNRSVITKLYEPSEIDYIAIYCPSNDKCYLIPYNQGTKKHLLTLRLSPTKNNQTKNVMYAEKYEV